MKYSPILIQITSDFRLGACTSTSLETIIYYDKGYLPIHTNKSLEYIQSNFKFSDN